MAIAWLEKLNPIYDYDMATHALRGAVCIAQTEAGVIHRHSSQFRNDMNHNYEEELSFLINGNSRQRERVTTKMNFNWAGKGGVDELGKASSAFLSVINDFVVIDYFVEDPLHVRSDAVVMHDYLRAAINYHAIAQWIDSMGYVMSGHIAPLNITQSKVGWLMLLDAFNGPQSTLHTSRDVLLILTTLKANRIVPITADGYLI